MKRFQKFLFFSAILCLCSNAVFALSPATPPLWIATFQFENDSSTLTDAQIERIDEIGSFIEKRCVGPWESPGWLQVNYFLFLTSEQRDDYQLAGVRMESVFRYARKFNVATSSNGLTIEIVTGEKSDRRDHSVQVAVQCKVGGKR